MAQERSDHVCGISGAYHDRTEAPVTAGRLRAMGEAQRHRGPDDGAVWTDGPVGLGHRRLSIIDLDGGRQPMANETGSVRVVFNGEIYNYQELRQSLRARGHRFATQSDTEVIVHLYEEEGPACVARLRGMFALAVWDADTRRLLLARDRAGEKPLVYAELPDGIVFASEIAALLEDERVPREIDMVALDEYLTHLYVPSPRTMLRAVRKLPPGHLLICEPGRRELRRYASLSFAEKEVLPEEEWIERAGAALREAVRVRLMSDVPLGAFLSGGIDSSAVVALMTELTGRKVATFSIGFAENEYNELPYARVIARQFETEHHEFEVRPDAIDVLPALVRHYGEPFGDSSALPLYYLAQLTRGHVTVALSGDGGDETFAGYPRYLNAVRGAGYPRAADEGKAAMKGAAVRGGRVGGTGWGGVRSEATWQLAAANCLSRLPHGVRRAAAGAAAGLPRGHGSRGTTERLRRFSRYLCLSPEERYADAMSYFPAHLKARLLTTEARASIVHARGGEEGIAPSTFAAAFQRADGPALLDRLLQVDTETYLPDDLMVKADIATMAHSLEARAPFLDPPLMELAARIPADLKVRGGETKYLLKRVVGRLLPPEILARPKAGFALPVDRWLRGPLRAYAEELLLTGPAAGRGLFDLRWLREFVDEHMEGRADHSGALWGLMHLELWQQMFLDRAAVRAVA
jgi:asparagine synthase (glutamine-hydrolysing)